MLDIGLSLVDSGRQRVGIIAQSRDGEAILFYQGVDPAGLAIIQSGDVNVSDTGITALRLTRRPAHQLYTVKPLFGRKGEEVFER
jgi:hypothetical protein